MPNKNSMNIDVNNNRYEKNISVKFQNVFWQEIVASSELDSMAFMNLIIIYSYALEYVSICEYRISFNFNQCMLDARRHVQ